MLEKKKFVWYSGSILHLKQRRVWIRNKGTPKEPVHQFEAWCWSCQMYICLALQFIKQAQLIYELRYKSLYWVLISVRCLYNTGWHCGAHWSRKEHADKMFAPPCGSSRNDHHRYSEHRSDWVKRSPIELIRHSTGKSVPVRTLEWSSDDYEILIINYCQTHLSRGRATSLLPLNHNISCIKGSNFSGWDIEEKSGPVWTICRRRYMESFGTSTIGISPIIFFSLTTSFNIPIE